MTKKVEIYNKIKDLKPELYKKYFIKSIGIFGSFSNNTYTENSDIDILIELEKPIGLNFFSLEIFLEKTLGRKIDLVTKNALKESLKENILKQVEYI
jgi:predicted nucleotidyltransferase